MAEVVGKLVDAGVSIRPVRELLGAAGVSVEPLTEDDAVLAGALRSVFSEERLFHSVIVAASHWELATKPPSSLQIEHGPIFHFPLQYDSFAEGHEVRERPVRPRARPYGEWVSPGGDGPD